MSALVITAKGQITLRSDLLEHLGVRPGGKLTISKLPNGIIETARSTDKISAAFGVLKTKRKGKSLSISGMNDIIAQGWSGKRR
jgi:bifunctional DNA-binding transcriptional regulator/antitoxin component of YhaV-PrlF toxin-antitoxin module